MSQKPHLRAHGPSGPEKLVCKRLYAPARTSTQTHQAAPAAFGIPLAGSALLTVGESAEVIGFQRDFLQAMIEEGRIEAHRPPGRERGHARITRRSLVAYMAQTATFNSEDLLSALFYLVGTLNDEQRAALLARMEKGRHCG